VLKRLDRLTQEEGRMTVAQTMKVVHGLVNNVKVVMNGTQTVLDCLTACDRVLIFVDGKASTEGIRNALGTVFTGFADRLRTNSPRR
jgi:hypothetical protein